MAHRIMSSSNCLLFTSLSSRVKEDVSIRKEVISEMSWGLGRWLRWLKWIKCLLCKHGGQSSDPRNPQKGYTVMV